nr:hypothetical protein [Tanacetum cinerariifolium]
MLEEHIDSSIKLKVGITFSKVDGSIEFHKPDAAIVRLPDDSSYIALHVAARKKSRDTLPEEAAIKAKNGFDAFHIAAKQGDLGSYGSTIEAFNDMRLNKHHDITHSWPRLLSAATPSIYLGM